MKCRQNVARIEEICKELMDIVDDSRTHCNNDECELIHCVVHDCVQKIRRVTSHWRPDTDLNTLEPRDRPGRTVN